ncbi:MAG TPA: FtsX-like permease family protein [Gammaproteobacteria bacterium]|nr:FtsX-like permease family protein [Gammaproteobacteria bacterium]
MPYSKFLPLVWAGIWRKRGRAVLMLLQIASAFALFGLLEGLNTGIKQAIAETHRDRLYIGSSVSLGDPLPISVLGTIRATPGIAFATPRQGLPGTYQQPDQQVGVIGVEAGPFFAIFDEYNLPQDAIAALENNRTGTLVGRDTMERFGWKIGDQVVLQSPVPRSDGSGEWAFDVVGSYDMRDDADQATALIANFAYVDEARFANRDTVQMFVAKIDDPGNAAPIGLAIDNAFANSANETRTQSEADLAASQIQRIGDLNYLARAIIAAVFFAMLFATGALMMQSIRERMPELAILKTVGFSDRLVMGLIIAEAVVFCLFAAGVGLGIAAFVLPMARQFIGIAGVPLVVVAAGLVFALMLALIGSSIPAWRGLKLQVADALAGR